VIVDFHGEATSEKTALGNFLDGKVSAVLAPHPRADCDHRILPAARVLHRPGDDRPYDSVIGVDKEASCAASSRDAEPLRDRRGDPRFAAAWWRSSPRPAAPRHRAHAAARGGPPS